jgi:methylmalonyl-CoA mutase N-terminal domain/subunit
VKNGFDQSEFNSASGTPISSSYNAAKENSGIQNIEKPGKYPFTRGIHENGFRSKLWTMRMFAGFGSAEETNSRFKYLLEQGQTGLSVAFDLPTLYGYDTDAPMAQGEFGKGGVAISSLADMEILFEGIPLDSVSTSMTINAPAAIIWAMYLAIADKRKIAFSKLRGTIQNDILKEYTAQNEYIFPIDPSMRLVVDTIEFAASEVPKWSPVSISGYHIREAGSTAIQEAAFTLANGFEYIESTLNRGLKIDEFSPQLSFFFNVHDDFFEEIAKFRASRRIWATQLKTKYRAQNDRSCWLRTHAQTSGATLTKQQAENNVVRVSLQALAATLGGVQSLHTNAMDEAISLPSEHSAQLALRTQQIIAHETGITDSVDPLGGSYYLEHLTNKIEKQCYDYFELIEQNGGVRSSINNGFFIKEIANSARKYQKDIEVNNITKIGVNKFVQNEEVSKEDFSNNSRHQTLHLNRLNQTKSIRDNNKVINLLTDLRKTSKTNQNLMPLMIELVKCYATVGEIISALKDVWGEYQGD